MKRRHFLSSSAATLALALAVGSLSTPADAMSTSEAEAFVTQATSQLQAIMNSGQSGQALQDQVRVFFRTYADGATVARTVIGSPWRGMSASQKSAYTTAFETYVVKKYTQRFDVLKGGQAKIIGSRDEGVAGVVVNAEFVRSVGVPVNIVFQVTDQGGQPKILDLRLEGVSLISQEREAVRLLLEQNGNDVDALTAALNA